MLRRLVPISLLLLVSGCSWFSWMPFIGDGEQEADEPAALVDFEEEVRLEVLWARGVGDGLGKKYLSLTPAVLADRVYAADGYGVVEAFDRFSGERLWRTRIGEPDDGGFLGNFNFIDRRDPSFVTGGVGVGAGLVLLGTTNAEVVALSAADGSERWRAEVSSEVLAQPVVGDGHVFVQTSDGRLVALDAENGERRWTFDTQVPVLTLRGTSAPVVVGDMVYAGFANGKVMAFSTSTGEPRWEQRIMLPQGRSELDRMVDVDGTPVVDIPFLFAASYQGHLKAMRLSDGAVQWERDTSSYLDLAEGYGNVYVVDEEDEVNAVDQRTANLVWEQAGLHLRGLNAPVAFSNYVVVADRDGYAHVIAQSDGRFLGRRKLDGDGVRSPMVVADGIVYVLGNSGRLVAFEIEPRA